MDDLDRSAYPEPPLLLRGLDPAQAWKLLSRSSSQMPAVPYIDVPDEGLTLYVGPQAKSLLGMAPDDIANLEPGPDRRPPAPGRP